MDAVSYTHLDVYKRQGQASVNGLYLGKYYVKEITPPTGYLADDVF